MERCCSQEVGGRWLLGCTDVTVWPKCMRPRLLCLAHDLNGHVGKHKVGWLIRRLLGGLGCLRILKSIVTLALKVNKIPRQAR